MTAKPQVPGVLEYDPHYPTEIMADGRGVAQVFDPLKVANDAALAAAIVARYNAHTELRAALAECVDAMDDEVATRGSTSWKLREHCRALLARLDAGGAK